MAKLEFMKLYPASAPLIASLIARGMDWEDAQQIADRLRIMEPAEVKQLEDSPDLENLPEEAKSAIFAARSQSLQLAQALQQTQKALAEAAKQLDDKNAILDTDRYKADSASQSKIDVASINAAVKMATDENAKNVAALTQQVTGMAQALSQTTGFIQDMQKKAKELADAEAAAAAKASAGPTPEQIDPAAASGVAKPAVVAS